MEVCECVSHSVVLTLCDPMDCSLPGSSVYGDSPAKNIGICSHSCLQGNFLTQGLNRVSCIAGRFFTYCLSDQRSLNFFIAFPYDPFDVFRIHSDNAISFTILVICVFSFFFIILVSGLSILLNFLKNQSLFHWFPLLFLFWF